jgi:hypothetical protein
MRQGCFHKKRITTPHLHKFLTTIWRFSHSRSQFFTKDKLVHAYLRERRRRRRKRRREREREREFD